MDYIYFKYKKIGLHIYKIGIYILSLLYYIYIIGGLVYIYIIKVIVILYTSKHINVYEFSRPSDYTILG